ncbi:MAG: hypothetical protein E4G98_06755 [Promethearchaeota archaeon]|nr:MAG: hypothetical protein E4G98_06755 [Candidatus Lokiarchaeota archaeon]
MPDIYSMLFFGKKCDLPTLIQKVPEVHNAFLQTSQTSEDSLEILALTWMGATSVSQQYIPAIPPILPRSHHSHRYSKIYSWLNKDPLRLKVQIITGLDGTIGIFLGLPIAQCTLEDSWHYTSLNLPTWWTRRRIRRCFSRWQLGSPEFYLLEVME